MSWYEEKAEAIAEKCCPRCGEPCGEPQDWFGEWICPACYDSESEPDKPEQSLADFRETLGIPRKCEACGREDSTLALLDNYWLCEDCWDFWWAVRGNARLRDTVCKLGLGGK